MTKIPMYSDGDIEVELLNFFSNTKVEDRPAKIHEILSNSPSWPIEYHMSPTRENLLNWMDFPNNDRALEIGAGCGALTGLLASKFKHLTALELSDRRTAVNSARHGHLGNIHFVTKNLETFAKKESFNYVICVGVLEYAGTYIKSENPYQTFLKQLHSFLKPGGKLVLAIENQHGIKYLSGAREDHTGRFYEGIEGYPINAGIQTFGRKKLDDLLTDTGFIHSEFFFPFPDYKMPSFVHSEKAVVGPDALEFPFSAFPTPAPDQSRLEIFSEQLAIEGFYNNGLYPFIANSFLIVTERGKS